MKRFKRILVAVEPNQDSVSTINRAALLAKRNNAELKVVGFVDELPENARNAESFPSTNVRDIVLNEAEAEIDRLIRTASSHGVPIESSLLKGVPFVEIIREVIREKHDLVILTAEGGGVKRWLFGSTSMHLMRKCPCPVWVIKPNGAKFGRILACVDSSPDCDPQAFALNEKVLQLAGSLAQRESAKLHIIHAWSAFGEQMLRRHSSQETADTWVGETKVAHESAFQSLLERIDFFDVEYETHLIKGLPRDILPEFAAKNEVDLMVMGTVSRTGVAGLLIGNTAETVLQQVQCSVLAVKPDGFVSPVSV